MVRKGSILFVTVETPLHAGTGAELGIVDLPIQRERHTGWPKVEASSLKGALREAIKFDDNPERDKELKKAIFGPEKGDLHGGALILTDLRILLFPVKSGKGTFAWVTSPEVFKRFRRDLIALANLDEKFEGLASALPEELVIPKKVDESSLGALVHNESELTVKVGNENVVLLEEYSFNAEKDKENLEKFVSWLKDNVFTEGNLRRDDLSKKICVVENDVFNDFVKMFTEVITRTKINQATGTVQTGALWNEEYLPSETVVYSLMMATPLMMKEEEKPNELKAEGPRDEAYKVLNKMIENLPSYIFLGGNETVGKGLVSLITVTKEKTS